MKSYPAKFKSFQRKIIQMEALQKLQNSIQTLINFGACLPNPYKLSVLGDIQKATICHCFPLNASILGKDS